MNPLSAFITVPKDRTKTIPLTNSDAVVLVSDIDYYRVSQYRWFLKQAKGRDEDGNPIYYAARSVRDGKRIRTVWLHRFIMGEPDGMDIHHKNDKLDCRREQMEVIDPAEHARKYNGTDEIDCGVPF